MRVRNVVGRSTSGRLIVTALSVISLLITVVALTVQQGGAAATPNLTGSNFESGDGNLVAGGIPGGNDWVTGTSATSSAPNFVGAQDLASGSGDNAFGQGSKEDIGCPTVVNGSIPPNKSDLTRFYTGWELGANGHYFLYLAWERSNVLGNANMDFEFQQDGSLCANSTTFTRTAGDRLVTFDFGGSGSPVLGLLTWVTTGSNSQCFSSNSLPCWGNHMNLSAAGEANGLVNTGTLSDPLVFQTANSGPASSPPPVSLPAGTFGEAGIDLTSAGVLSPGGPCTFLGSAQLNSRSSSSFTSEIKDFIAPVPVNITNCGSITIKKTYSSTAPTTPPTFTLYHDADNGLDTYQVGTDTLATYPGTTTVGAGGITDSATTLAVADATKLQDATTHLYPLPFYVLVDSEYMQVTGVSTNNLTVVRGKNSSTAVTHSAGATVTRVAACDPTTFVAADSAYECTLSGLPFGWYVVRETVVAGGYTQAADTFKDVTSQTPAVSDTVNNVAAPVDIAINKYDDRGVGNPVQLCGDGTVTACAKFQLFKSSAASTLLNAITAPSTSVTLAAGGGTTFPASDFYVVVDKEIMHVTSRASDVLTVDARGADGTAAASHNGGAAVNALTFVSDCTGTVIDLAGGHCIFSSIIPGSYWIAEVQQPAGYGVDSSLAKSITVSLGDTTVNQTYNFTNPRLFKVITFVCQESTGSLYASSVALGSSTKTSSATGSLPLGITESTLCGLTGGAVFPDLSASANAYTGSVTIQ